VEPKIRDKLKTEQLDAITLLQGEDDEISGKRSIFFLLTFLAHFKS